MYSKIIKETFDLISYKKIILIKSLLIPFFLLLGIEYYANHITNLITKGESSLNPLLILYGLSFIVTLIMSISIHRILLLNEEQLPKWGIYKFSTRELKFLLVSVGVTILVFLIVYFFYFMAILIGKSTNSFYLNFFILGLGVLIATYIFSRISLIFPSIAIDEDMSILESFNITKKYKLLTFMTVIILPLFFSVVVAFVYGFIIKIFANLISINLNILSSLLNIFIAIFVIGFLSVTYDFIIENEKKYIREVPLKDIEFEENGKLFKIIIDDRYNTDFEKIKDDIIKQFTDLDFTNIVIDKQDSWMVKKEEETDSYILVSHLDKQFIIETYNIEKKPIIELD